MFYIGSFVLHVLGVTLYHLAMKRTSTADLEKWLERPNRKPLVLRGARQVGKSTLVRMLAAERTQPLIEINLELHRDLDPIFASLDMEQIVLNLENIAGTRICDDHILFLDEIQSTPHALAALRYFHETRPRLPVIAAGSLLEFALADHSFSMPVGRMEYFHLGPMTFAEYLEARDPVALESLRSLDPWQPFPVKAHHRLLRRQREFMLIGGMPEAIDAYLSSESFEEVARVQNSICGTYVDDFSKYARHKDLASLQTLFRSIPRVIGDKLKYVNLLPEAKSAYVRNILRLLCMARLCTEVRRSACGGLPLAAGVDPKFSKLLFLDVGLVSRLLGTDWIDLQQCRERTLVNEGPLAEQFIGQHLHWSSQTSAEHFYWAREGKGKSAELDFVTSRGQLMVPIEVKAGKSGTLKSLHVFMHRPRRAQAIRFDLQPPSVQEIATSISTARGQQPVSYRLISLPLYAVGSLPALLDRVQESSA